MLLSEDNAPQRGSNRINWSAWPLSLHTVCRKPVAGSNSTGGQVKRLGCPRLPPFHLTITRVP